MANPLGCAVAVAIFGILWGWLPFGVPCLWFWLAKLNDGAYRYFFAALWFWQMFAPSLLARDVHLDSIREWAGHGPMGLESTAPITGVFYPNGYPGLSVIDTSWCTWFAADKMLACPAGSPFTAWELGGSNLTAIAKKNSGFVPIGFRVTGTAIDKGFTAPTLPFHPFGGMPLYHPWMRNVMHFHFNEALNEAQVLENVCLLGTNLCITCHFMHSTVNMMMVKEGDGWIRNDYPASFTEYVKNGFRNEPAWTSKKLPRVGGSVYSWGKWGFPAGYKWELLLSKDGVRSSILKRAKLTGSVVKQSMHVLFPGGYLGENFF